MANSVGHVTIEEDSTKRALGATRPALEFSSLITLERLSHGQSDAQSQVIQRPKPCCHPEAQAEGSGRTSTELRRARSEEPRPPVTQRGATGRGGTPNAIVILNPRALSPWRMGCVGVRLTTMKYRLLALGLVCLAVITASLGYFATKDTDPSSEAHVQDPTPPAGAGITATPLGEAEAAGIRMRLREVHYSGARTELLLGRPVGRCERQPRSARLLPAECRGHNRLRRWAQRGRSWRNGPGTVSKSNRSRLRAVANSLESHQGRRFTFRISD